MPTDAPPVLRSITAGLHEALVDLMRLRILVLDGAYGSAFQYALSEEAFRGEQYAQHDHPPQAIMTF